MKPIACWRKGPFEVTAFVGIGGLLYPYWHVLFTSYLPKGDFSTYVAQGEEVDPALRDQQALTAAHTFLAQLESPLEEVSL